MAGDPKFPIAMPSQISTEQQDSERYKYLNSTTVLADARRVRETLGIERRYEEDEWSIKWKKQYDGWWVKLDKSNLDPSVGLLGDVFPQSDVGNGSRVFLHLVGGTTLWCSDGMFEFYHEKLKGTDFAYLAAGFSGYDDAARLIGLEGYEAPHPIDVRSITLVDPFTAKRMEKDKIRHTINLTPDQQEKAKKIVISDAGALEYLRQQPTGSKNIVITSFDLTVVSNEDYHRAIALEAFRVVPEDGIFMVAVSDVMEIDAKGIFPFFKEYGMVNCFSKSPLPNDVVEMSKAGSSSQAMQTTSVEYSNIELEKGLALVHDEYLRYVEAERVADAAGSDVMEWAINESIRTSFFSRHIENLVSNQKRDSDELEQIYLLMSQLKLKHYDEDTENYEQRAEVMSYRLKERELRANILSSDKEIRWCRQSIRNYHD